MVLQEYVDPILQDYVDPRDVNPILQEYVDPRDIDPILQEYVDPRDVKMNELEKVIAQYQDKLNDVTSNYQQKIGILKLFMDHQH